MLNHADLNSQLNDLVTATHWYLGFSGGVDSTVLLHLLHSWRIKNPTAPPLSAIHINHGLQSAAAGWEHHCERVCRTLQLPLVTRSVDVSAAGSGEAAARSTRYQVFEEQLQPGAVLFLAHHLDDQVETFFLRLMRGAGVEGLAAMPRSRALGQGMLVRPLLDCSRSQIEQYARQHNLTHVEDPSNSDTAMDRNFLRARLLPELATRWPAYRQSVSRASEHMAAVSRVLAEELGPADTVHSVMGDPGVALAQLIAPREEAAAMRLRGWLRVAGWRAPDHAALKEFLRQLRGAADDASPRLDCGDYCLQRYGDAVYLVPAFGELPPGNDLRLAAGERVRVPGVGTVSLESSPAEGLRLAPGESLTLKWRQGGERCRLPGKSGSSSLKKLLQEWGVPPWWRDRLPLLYLGGELLAVGDLARCESERWCTSTSQSEHLWSVNWERVFNT